MSATISLSMEMSLCLVLVQQVWKKMCSFADLACTLEMLQHFVMLLLLCLICWHASHTRLSTFQNALLHGKADAWSICASHLRDLSSHILHRGCSQVDNHDSMCFHTCSNPACLVKILLFSHGKKSIVWRYGKSPLRTRQANWSCIRLQWVRYVLTI